jgi:hypothetical protein
MFWPAIGPFPVTRSCNSQIGNVAAPFLELCALIAHSTPSIYTSRYLSSIDLYCIMMYSNCCSMWIFSEGCSKQLPSIFGDFGGYLWSYIFYTAPTWSRSIWMPLKTILYTINIICGNLNIHLLPHSCSLPKYISNTCQKCKLGAFNME